MLKQVTARNWRAFDAVDVELRPGLNVLLGPNGVGKTSLLEATAFALAGAPSTLPDPKQMIRTDGQPVDVAVTLELDGARWEVSRGLGPAGHLGAVALRRDGASQAEGSERVAASLERQLGVPSDFYLRVLYMPEGDVYRFLSNPPLAALDAHLRRVLGLEQLARIDQAAGRKKREIDNARDRLTPLAQQVAERDQALAAARGRWSGDLLERRTWLEAQRARLSGARDAAVTERQAAADAVHNLQRHLDELAAIARDLAPLAAGGDPAPAYADALHECARLQTAVKRLDEEVADATARQKLLAEQRKALAVRGPAELAAAEPSLAALLAETETAVEGLADALKTAAVERQVAAERELTLRTRAPADLVADDPALRTRRDEQEATLRRIDDRLAAAANDQKSLRESTEFLAAHAPGAGVEPTCPVCRQPLPEELRQRLLGENAAREAALTAQVAALQGERAAEVAAGQAEAQALKQRLLDENTARAAAAAQREAALQAERQELTASVRSAADAVRARLLGAHDADALALDEQIATLRAERQTEQAALEAAEQREGAALKGRQRLDDLTKRRQALLPGDATEDSLRAKQVEAVATEGAAREREATIDAEFASVQQELSDLTAHLRLASLAGRSPEALAAAQVALARRELLAELFAAAPGRRWRTYEMARSRAPTTTSRTPGRSSSAGPVCAWRLRRRASA
jgi:exonuclease SbcC